METFYILKLSTKEVNKIILDCHNTLAVLAFSMDAPSENVKRLSLSILAQIESLKRTTRETAQRLGTGREEYEYSDKSDLL